MAMIVIIRLSISNGCSFAPKKGSCKRLLQDWNVNNRTINTRRNEPGCFETNMRYECSNFLIGFYLIFLAIK